METATDSSSSEAPPTPTEAPPTIETPPTSTEAPPTSSQPDTALTDHIQSESQATGSAPPPSIASTEDKPSPTSSASSKKKPSVSIHRVPSGQSSLATLSTLASTTSSDSLNLLILSSENDEDLTGRSGLAQSSPEALSALGVVTPSSSAASVGGAEVFLVDSMELLTEEKEVGEEIPSGDVEGLADAAASIADDLEKSLNTSELVRGNDDCQSWVADCGRSLDHVMSCDLHRAPRGDGGTARGSKGGGVDK